MIRKLSEKNRLHQKNVKPMKVASQEFKNQEKEKKMMGTQGKENKKNLVCIGKQCNSIRQRSNNYSDYELFLSSSEYLGKNDYPSAFRLLRISKRPKINMENIEMASICPLECSRIQLIQISTSLLYENEFCIQIMRRQNVLNLIKGIAGDYHSVSYHNFTHGFSLMQLFHRCIHVDPSFANLFSQEEIILYLLAALAHDIGHPGTNNSFEVKLKTELSAKSNGESVLEKMHVQRFFKIMREAPNSDIISRTTDPCQSRKIIIEAILATDIANHFANIKILEKIIAEKEQIHSKNKKFVIGQVFHACDIGNPTLEFKDYLNWAALLTYEFNEQAKLQKSLGFNVDKFLVYTNTHGFLNEQKFFLGTFVLPLWKQLSLAFPGFSGLSQRVGENLQKLQELQDEEKA